MLNTYSCKTILCFSVIKIIITRLKYPHIKIHFKSKSTLDGPYLLFDLARIKDKNFGTRSLIFVIYISFSSLLT